MHPMFKFHYADSPVSHDRREEESAISNRIMLRLARITIVVMMTALGFLLTGYINAMHRAVEKIGDTQDRMSVILTRIDVTVRDIDRRVAKTEQRLDRLISKPFE